MPPRPLAAASPEKQPFRQECTLVAATFLRPSAPYELALPSPLPSSILRDLAYNTHPDVFLPAYEHAYDALLTHSLPSFLDGMHENMNWEKKLYWVAYGALTFLVGWAIALGCIFGGVSRKWRVWAVPFLCLGGMQMYAGYRGSVTFQEFLRGDSSRVST